ncbi:MAG TPA: cyclase family protein [Polyangia bacterium]|jgi:arylformamidase
MPTARAPRWIDVSVPIRPGMPRWPGDPAIRVARVAQLAHGDDANVSTLAFGAHTGTHVDAPRHYLAGGVAVDAMPLEATVGPARVIGIRDPDRITADELRDHAVRRGERLLLRTRNSGRVWRAPRFQRRYVALTKAAAELLAARRVRAVGIDALSVGPFGPEGAEVHRALLGAGVWIIEGLDLARVRPGPCELCCLPLKLVGADGAPARVIVRPLRGDAA